MKLLMMEIIICMVVFFSKVFKRKLNSNHEYEILILYNNNDNNILINTNQTIKLK